MTIKEARKAIENWMIEEFELEDGTVLNVGTEPDNRISIVYNQYHEEIIIDEQWYADLENKVLYCELDGERAPEMDIHCDSLKVLVNVIDYGFLTAVADTYIDDTYFGEE